MADDDRAVEVRAQELGLTILELLALEQREPWIKHESARFGEAAPNIRRWLAAGRPIADRNRLCISGSPRAIKLVRALLDRLPAAVVWFTVEHIGIAWTPPGVGLTAPWPRPPANPTGRIDMAFEVTERNLGLVGHELAHAFTRDPELFADLTSAEIEELDEMVAARLGPEQTERSYLTEEAADALASVWLGETVNTRSTREYGHRVAIGGTP